MKPKLIRDRIPEIAKANGVELITQTLESDDFKQALKNKLIEEAQEVSTAESKIDLVKEMADVADVLQTIADTYAITLDEIETHRQMKRQNAGGFTQQLLLVSRKEQKDD